MGVTDDDADKMLAVNSNSQCYKQAGNSIVVSVLEAIFRQLGIKGVEAWNKAKGEHGNV
jgi:DNA (cytosine-5)-methyltransferase 1